MLNRMNPAPAPRPTHARSRPGRRRGSVIVVVIGLLGALMLLGFLFLTLALQEEQNARYYSESAKTVEYDPNVFFNWALEQIILGAPDERRDSVLWGGRASLLPNLVGDDLVPHDGPGVNLGMDDAATALPQVDQDMNGAADTGAVALRYDRLNLSPASQYNAASMQFDANDASKAQWLNNLRGPNGLPAPDAGYTYPDVNSPFLTYIGTEPGSVNRVVIPAFHRPQLLRNRTAANDWSSLPDAKADTDADGIDDNPDAYHDWYRDFRTLPLRDAAPRGPRRGFDQPGRREGPADLHRGRRRTRASTAPTDLSRRSTRTWTRTTPRSRIRSRTSSSRSRSMSTAKGSGGRASTPAARGPARTVRPRSTPTRTTTGWPRRCGWTWASRSRPRPTGRAASCRCSP